MDAATPGLRLIQRGDLLAELDRAVTGKVTVISAPAGSGKSSLLRTWAHRPRSPHRLAVVQVRRGERDAQLFWLALLDAVRQASGAAEAAPSPATPDFNGPAIVERVLAELAAVDGGIVLVIDDLHELADPEAFPQLTELLTKLPRHAHAVLATRRDLPLRLHQLRLAGELTEIRAARLRFSEQESRELLDASGVKLSESAAALLHQRTEGWAAGLRLAALSLAQHPDPESFVAQFTGSDRTVAEYLIAEMLEHQPRHVQELLLRTCLLDSLNGELADLLTGGSGAERILLELEDANAFVVSLDPERTWFRYHHLFADFLRLELRRRMPEEVPALHRAAARWLAAHDRVADAARHLQAVGDWAGAAELLADHAISLMLDGQAQTVHALLRTFPQEVCADHPELAVARAVTDFVHGRLDEAAGQLAVAEAYAGTVAPERRGRLRVATALLSLSLARRQGRFSDVAEQADLLSAPLDGQAGEPLSLGGDLRIVALMNLGIVEAWSLRLEDGERYLHEGAVLARQFGRPYLEVGCLAHLAFASKGRSFATALQRCREAIALAERHGWGTEPVIAPALVTLAGTLTWMARFDEGETWLERAARAARGDEAPGLRMMLHLVRGMQLAGRGRHGEALEEFTAAELRQAQLAGSHGLSSQVTGWMIAAQARVGLVGEARANLAGLVDDRAKSGEIRNAHATVLLAQGRPADALDALHDVLSGSAPVIYGFTLIEAELLGALAHQALGEPRAANLAVDRALAAAESDRLLLPFAMPGARALLEAVPRHETAHAALLADVLDVLRGSCPEPFDLSAAPARELSPTELKVLRYLPTNLSRQEIAVELSVSLNTVNTHVRSIYAKLGANDRSSAVQRARRLRLLSASGMAR